MSSQVLSAFACYALENNTLDQIIARAHNDAYRLKEIAEAQKEEAENPLEKKKQIEQCFKQLAHLKESIASQTLVIKLIRRKISWLSDSEALPYEKYVQLIESSHNDALQNGLWVFDKIFTTQVGRINKKFSDTVDTLNAFRTTPTKTTLDEAEAAFKKLQNQVTLLHSFSDKCNVSLTPLETESLEDIDLSTKRLQVIIDPNSQKIPTPLFTKLAIICNRVPISLSLKEEQEIKKQGEGAISQLEKQDQDSLDGWIYKLAPPPKGGKEWGRIHRFDDLARFRNAFSKTILASIERRLQNEEEGPHLKDRQVTVFWESLHQLAFGPQVDDSIAWAKNELPVIGPLVKEALLQVVPDYKYGLSEVNHQNEEIDLPREDSKDKISIQEES